MSANNYIFIKETSQGYEVSERDADNDSFAYSRVRTYKSLKTAIKKAQEIEVEYGLHFVFFLK